MVAKPISGVSSGSNQLIKKHLPPPSGGKLKRKTNQRTGREDDLRCLDHTAEPPKELI